jgi:hypothetical protein
VEDGKNYPLHFENCHFFTRRSAHGIHPQAFATSPSAKVTAQKRSNRAGATPLFCGRSAQKCPGSLPPSQALRVDVLRGCTRVPRNLSDRMSDILYQQERKNPLPILKSPPKQQKAVTVQARVEFIDASTSYVITEALKLLFRKDADFRRWADQHTNNHNHGKLEGDVLTKAV